MANTVSNPMVYDLRFGERFRLLNPEEYGAPDEKFALGYRSQDQIEGTLAEAICDSGIFMIPEDAWVEYLL